MKETQLSGEMSGEEIRQRSIDALRRSGVKLTPGNLLIYARDVEEEFKHLFPTIGRMPPLNCSDGWLWILNLLDKPGRGVLREPARVHSRAVSSMAEYSTAPPWPHRCEHVIDWGISKQ